MEKEIRLYGPLAKFIGKRRFFAEVSSAGEAIRMLVANFPGLERHMADWHYKVVVDNYESSLEEVNNPVSGCIQIIPVVAGAGFWSTLGKIIAGVALVAVSFVSFGAGAWAGVLGSYGVGAGAALGSMAALGVGTALILGGVSQLLSPTPQIGSLGPATSFAPIKTTENSQLDPQGQDSYSFSGIQNTSQQATPVPIAYGETVVGSVTISAGLDVDNK
jgi:predicted phage tail protein